MPPGADPVRTALEAAVAAAAREPVHTECSASKCRTLAAARRLKKAGMDEAHAEAVAESLRDAVTGSVAAKRDPDAAEVELREGITAVKAETGALKCPMAFVVGLLLGPVGKMFEILWAQTPRFGPDRLPPTSCPKTARRLRSGRQTPTAPSGHVGPSAPDGFGQCGLGTASRSVRPLPSVSRPNAGKEPPTRSTPPASTCGRGGGSPPSAAVRAATASFAMAETRPERHPNRIEAVYGILAAMVNSPGNFDVHTSIT